MFRCLAHGKFPIRGLDTEVNRQHKDTVSDNSAWLFNLMRIDREAESKP
jgi:hypothetical protein